MPLGMLDTVLPSGVSGSTLVALYQFDGPTLGLTDRSGNGHDLTMNAGTDIYEMTDQSERCLQTYSASWTFPWTAAKSATFNETGALTIEWTAKVQEYDTGSDMTLFVIGNLVSGSSSLNTTCAVLVMEADADPCAIRVIHEHGGGVNDEVEFPWTIPFARLGHMALTRAADGKTYKLHSDGELLDTQVAANAPDGGAGAIRIILMGHSTTYNRPFYGSVGSWRYCKGVEFTAAQVLESYNRIHV
jgi:hypothetical protein